MNEVVGTLTTLVVFALILRVQRASHTLGHAPEGRNGEGSPSCRFGAQPYCFEDGGGRAFNETPQEWRLRSLDPACEPRELVAPLLNTSRRTGPSANQLVIMIFGDRCAWLASAVV